MKYLSVISLLVFSIFLLTSCGEEELQPTPNLASEINGNYFDTLSESNISHFDSIFANVNILEKSHTTVDVEIHTGLNLQFNVINFRDAVVSYDSDADLYSISETQSTAQIDILIDGRTTLDMLIDYTNGDFIRLNAVR